jgi:hypothetical protein
MLGALILRKFRVYNRQKASGCNISVILVGSHLDNLKITAAFVSVDPLIITMLDSRSVGVSDMGSVVRHTYLA